MRHPELCAEHITDAMARAHRYPARQRTASAPMLVDGAINRDIFLPCLDNVWLPHSD